MRKEINDWVARYRRDATFSGRPSYGNTYRCVGSRGGWEERVPAANWAGCWCWQGGWLFTCPLLALARLFTTRSAVNAMAGHLNSFGPTAPLPKKRLERMVKARGGGGCRVP